MPWSQMTNMVACWSEVWILKESWGKRRERKKNQEINIMNNVEWGIIIKSSVWLGNGSGKMEVKRRGAQETEGARCWNIRLCQYSHCHKLRWQSWWREWQRAESKNLWKMKGQWPGHWQMPETMRGSNKSIIMRFKCWWWVCLDKSLTEWPKMVWKQPCRVKVTCSSP